MELTAQSPGQASSTDDRDIAGFVVASGARLLERLQALELTSFEVMPPEDAARRLSGVVASDLLSLLGAAERLLSSVPALLGYDNGAVAEGDEELDLDAFGSDAFEGAPEPPRDRTLEEVDASLARLTQHGTARGPDREQLIVACRMLLDELQRSRDRFRQVRAQRSKWGLITEGDEVHRKTRKALILLMAMIADALELPLTSRPEVEQSELAIALRVRDGLMQLRRTIVGVLPVDVPLAQEAHLEASAKGARDLLEAFFTSSVYRQVRATDRYELRRFAARLSSTADDLAATRQALADLAAFVQLLRAVNSREILLRHDREVIERNQAALADLAGMLSVGLRDGWAYFAGILEHLARVRWRSEQLDAHVAAEWQRGADSCAPLETRVAALRAALDEVRF